MSRSVRAPSSVSDILSTHQMEIGVTQEQIRQPGYKVSYRQLLQLLPLIDDYDKEIVIGDWVKEPPSRISSEQLNEILTLVPHSRDKRSGIILELVRNSSIELSLEQLLQVVKNIRPVGNIIAAWMEKQPSEISQETLSIFNEISPKSGVVLAAYVKKLPRDLSYDQLLRMPLYTILDDSEKEYVVAAWIEKSTANLNYRELKRMFPTISERQLVRGMVNNPTLVSSAAELVSLLSEPKMDTIYGRQSIIEPVEIEDYVKAWIEKSKFSFAQIRENLTGLDAYYKSKVFNEWIKNPTSKFELENLSSVLRLAAELKLEVPKEKIFSKLASKTAFITAREYDNLNQFFKAGFLQEQTLDVRELYDYFVSKRIEIPFVGRDSDLDFTQSSVANPLDRVMHAVFTNSVANKLYPKYRAAPSVTRSTDRVFARPADEGCYICPAGFFKAIQREFYDDIRGEIKREPLAFSSAVIREIISQIDECNIDSLSANFIKDAVHELLVEKIGLDDEKKFNEAKAGFAAFFVLKESDVNGNKFAESICEKLSGQLKFYEEIYENLAVKIKDQVVRAEQAIEPAAPSTQTRRRASPTVTQRLAGNGQGSGLSEQWI